MAEDTKIAWATSTFNPWMGCTKVSPGCTNCYAETLTTNRMGLNVWGPMAKRQRTTPSYWGKPRRWNKDAEDDLNRYEWLRDNPDYASRYGLEAIKPQPHLVFCASLCDWAEKWDGLVVNAKGTQLFYDENGRVNLTYGRAMTLDDIRADLWQCIRETPNLIWMMLTKRTDRIQQLLPEDWGEHGYHNVWLGTTIESGEYAHRADILRKIPAVTRFISYEPAIGPLNNLDLTGIDWVIYGGESGPGFRPEDKQWARDMRDMCAAAGTAFFHKQSAAIRTEMGVELDGVIHHEYPTPRTVPVTAPTLF